MGHESVQSYDLKSDIVLIEKLDETPLSTVIHTEYGQDDKVWYGTVLSTGPGRRDRKGRLVPMDVQTGDTVMVGSYTGERHFMLDGEVGDLVAVREPDIIAVVE